MAILVPEQASLGMGSSSIVPRETFAGMKDPGNKGAGLMSLAKALSELGATFGDIEAKRKAEQEALGIDTAYWDATSGLQSAGMDGEIGSGGGGGGGLFGGLFGGNSVGNTKPSPGDVNNFNSRTYTRVQAARRKHSGEFETTQWLGNEGYLNPENIPANVREDPEQFERYLHAGRQKLVQQYRSDHVAGSAALKTFDNEADKLRGQMGAWRADEFKKREVESYTRGLDGSEDGFGEAAKDPADVSMLQQPASPNSRYKTKGRPIVPELDGAIRDVAGDTWMGEYMVAASRVESAGGRDLANPNSTARGPFQFIKSTAAQYGLRNPMDFRASAKAMAKFTMDNHRALSRALGREPAFAELYLAHQQGVGGAIKLLSNPNKRAADIVGAKAVKLNGGRMNMTAREFAGLWLNKFNKKNGIGNTMVAGKDFKERMSTAANDPVQFSKWDGQGGALVRDEDLKAFGVDPQQKGSGLKITSADPAFTPEQVLDDPYPGDENEGQFEYESQGGEKYVNEDGDEVVYVPDNPMVLSERRKLLQHDAEFDKSSTLSRRERRDISYDFYTNKALETKDPAYLDVMPPEWLTPEQRANTVKLRDQMASTKDEEYLRSIRVKTAKREEALRERKSDLIKRKQAGEELDPFTEARDENGKLDEDLFNFTRGLVNVETVSTRVSSATRATIVSNILSSSISGEWDKLGFDGPPSDGDLIDYIMTHEEMNADDKAALLGQVDELQKGANIMNSPDVNRYYEDTIGLTVKSITNGFIDTKDPQSITAFGPLQQQTRKFFDMQMRRGLQAYMEENESVPRGNALYEIQKKAEEATTTWFNKTALPAAQAQHFGQPAGRQFDQNGNRYAPAPTMANPPQPAAGMEGYERTVDENGVITYTRKQQ